MTTDATPPREAAKQSAHLTTLTLEAVLKACLDKNLLTKKQARYVTERQSIQEAKIAAHRSQAESKDPVTQLLSFGLEPPGREGRPRRGDDIQTPTV